MTTITLTKFKDVKTPESLPPDYDWRKEPWVDESGITDLEYTQAFHVVTAMAAAPTTDDATAQDEEDAVVFAMLRPDAMERIYCTEQADEVCRYRVVTAVAISLRLMREAWVRKHGSAEAKDPNTR